MAAKNFTATARTYGKRGQSRAFARATAAVVNTRSVDELNRLLDSDTWDNFENTEAIVNTQMEFDG